MEIFRLLLLGVLLMLLPPGEGGRSSSLSVPKVPDALLSAVPIRERSDCMAATGAEVEMEIDGGGRVVG
jgi:hypothetical protein